MTKADRGLDVLSIVISIVCLIMVGILAVSVAVIQEKQFKYKQEINELESDLVEWEKEIADGFTKLENEIRLLKEKELDSEEILTLENQIQELIDERNLIERVYSKLFNEYLDNFDINDFEIWLKTNYYDLWKEAIK